MLDEQRRQMHENFEQVAATWLQAQSDIDRLSAESVRSEVFDEMRQQQAEDRERMLAMIGAQRRDLETLVEEANHRCDHLLERMNALPEAIATADDLAAIRSEHARQVQQFAETLTQRKVHFDETLRALVRQQDATQKALEHLAERTASVDDLENLAERHDRTEKAVDALAARTASADEVQGLREQHGEQERRVESLNRRWEKLANSVRRLASSVTPASTFRQANESLLRDLNALREQIDTERAHREGELSTVRDQTAQSFEEMINVVREATHRLTALEVSERPRPVTVELMPQAASTLAEMVDAARREHEEFRRDLEAGRSVGETLRALAGEVRDSLDAWRTQAAEVRKQSEQSLEAWRAQADEVRKQSEQLRDSARMAADILRAMQKCNTTINARLNSDEWQTALARGEKTALRLEQTAHIARATRQQLVEAVRQAQQQITGHVERAVANSEAAAERLNQAVEGRRKVLAAIARSTASLVTVIGNSRDTVDLRQAPEAGSLRDDAGDRTAEPIRWRRFQMHPAVVK
jgi:chromosome segregation ATPase